jgi:release factor glutamine methyltransferase
MRAGVTLGDGSRSAPALATRAQALAQLRERLTRAGVVSPEAEAEWLLLHALGIGRTAYWSEPRAPLLAGEEATLEALAVRRERREPLQHILGEVPFHDAVLTVEPGVFLPRPETEHLVEVVLDALGAGDSGGSRPGRDGRPAARGTLLDWGTGTGAIAVALLKALPGWRAVAADRSRPAFDLALRNAARNGVADRFRAMEADFAGFPKAGSIENSAVIPGGPFNLVVSNPPYVRRGDIPGLMPEVRDHDPWEALDGGEDGLDAHRHLARGLGRWLAPGGLLALEIGTAQADDVLGLFGALIQDARVLPDRAGMPRIVIGTMRGE